MDKVMANRIANDPSLLKQLAVELRQKSEINRNPLEYNRRYGQ